MYNAFRSRIFSIEQDSDFEEIALQLFLYQAEHNTVYKQYLKLIRKNPALVQSIQDIPFLPVSFFKSQDILTGYQDFIPKQEPLLFTSSTTTGAIPGKHVVPEIALYEESFTRAFAQFYGAPSDWCFLALLPSYLERSGSSLVYMAEKLISTSRSEHSGFYLKNYDELIQKLSFVKKEQIPTILLGVSYALLDVAELKPEKNSNLVVMETGGMKGNRPEMIRENLHAKLKDGFGVDKIHSEYGMTELLSQAYSKGDGLFHTPPWMRILIRDVEDPFQRLPEGRRGGIDIIDLANLHSCAFISTQDLGVVYPDKSFEVIGRFDNSEIRGCNLMIQQ